MKEREFFDEICHIALATSRNVRFAGVMDDAGKLLTGRYRPDIKTPLVRSSSEPDTKTNLFYASYQSVSQTKPYAPMLGPLKYQLSEYDNVKLVTVPLTVRNDRFLCVSLDPTERCQATIAKLIDSI